MDMNGYERLMGLVATLRPTAERAAAHIVRDAAVALAGGALALEDLLGPAVRSRWRTCSDPRRAAELKRAERHRSVHVLGWGLVRARARAGTRAHSRDTCVACARGEDLRISGMAVMLL
jgi:hypothetical protein